MIFNYSFEFVIGRAKHDPFAKLKGSTTLPMIDEAYEERSVVVQNIDYSSADIITNTDVIENKANIDKSETVSVLSSEYNPFSVSTKKSVKKTRKLNQREQDVIDKAKAKETFT